MLVSDFVSKVNYALRGTDDDAPTEGTDEYLYWLDIFNRKKDELYLDPKNWSAIYNQTAPNELGTVATAETTALTGTGTYFTDYRVGDQILVSGETVRTIATIVSDTSLTVTVAFSNTASALSYTHNSVVATGVEAYSLHRSFLSPSNRAFVIDTTGQTHYFDVIKPEERDPLSQNIFIAGMNPMTLNFTSEIASTENIVGGTLHIPGYYLPADVSTDTDVIPLTDPTWGVAATAAEISFGDITYEDKMETLNAKANYLYSLMTKRNRKGVYNSPRITSYNVKRIPDTRR